MDTECYHCGKPLDSSSHDTHTDEVAPEYWVESCEDCCTVCKKEGA